MADQSNLTITGIGGDPSGSHPIGNLNTNWDETLANDSLLYTAGTIMADPGASIADATDTYYSEVLCVGPLVPGMAFVLGDTGDAQITACWQWYNPATSGVDADFVAGAALGTAGTFGNGTWTNIASAAQNFGLVSYNSDESDVALQCAKGTMLRVAMIVTDAGSNGVSAGLVTAGVAAINAATCAYPFKQQGTYNKSIVAAYAGQAVAGSIGGIGADPS